MSPPRLLPGGGAGTPRSAERAPGRVPAAPASGARERYFRLFELTTGADRETQQAAARSHLESLLSRASVSDCDLPDDPNSLPEWMSVNVARTGARYAGYLSRRHEGGPREYFASRSAALCVLRAIAPTKLVDGAWLYGTLAHAGDPLFGHLVRTYLEELGEGAPDKNHVGLYRKLLQTHQIEDWEVQPDSHFEQGAVQLALGACADEFMPEVIGFNLGYEQLPLHLLITAYELNELGIDPYYFTLHVTVDNAASGHARRAIQAAQEATSTASDPAEFWRRVRRGYALNDIGLGTTAAIEGFDLHNELLRVLGSKSAEGKFAHSDRCRIEGRTVNDWLASPDGVGGFVQALERKGWLVSGSDPADSRFWNLLHGERAQMFGVFSAYERQVVYDWIRGDTNKDGAAAPSVDNPAGDPRSVRPFHLQLRTRPGAAADLAEGLQRGLAANSEVEFDQQLASLDSPEARLAALLDQLHPSRHWTQTGLHATRLFVSAAM
ncbi:MAG: iron-containing redox enzyme family protein [Gammaproteobacteria bacterium]|nr:iron-containing redox enzyme family protein [Gammaproteobacteria bacterium]